MRFPVKQPLVVIVGPTAVGKTDLAIDIATRLDGEIISADSRYFYRGMNIGTAKPDLTQMRSVKHHLINIAEINQNFNLTTFQTEAVRIVQDSIQREKLPILVGGTGQYIWSVVEGWKIPQKAPDEVLRSTLEKIAQKDGLQKIHKWLEILDLQSANAIDYRNTRRVIRALEVILTTGYPFSEQKRKKPIDFQYKIIGLCRPREELYERIDQRVEEMLHSGFIQEVKQLIERGYNLKDPPMSAIGYREIILYLKQKIPLEEVKRLIKRRTRQFVRRQANWFKLDDTRIAWFKMESGVAQKITDFICSPEGWIDEQYKK